MPVKGGIKPVEPLLAQRTAHELSYPGHEEVEARDGLAPGRVGRVHAHVERLERGGVVRDEHGPARVLLREPALVLALQRRAPRRCERERARVRGVVRLEQRDGVGVCEAHPGRGGGGVRLERARVRGGACAGVCEGGPVWTRRGVMEDGAEGVFDDRGDVVDSVCEGPFCLEHPELGEVTRGLGALCAEAGGEGVYPRDGRCDSLKVELRRHGEVCGSAEVFGRFLRRRVRG